MQIKSLQVSKHPTVNLICDVAKFHKKPIEGICNKEQMSCAVHMQLDIPLLESHSGKERRKDRACLCTASPKDLVSQFELKRPPLFFSQLLKLKTW